MNTEIPTEPTEAIEPETTDSEQAPDEEKIVVPALPEYERETERPDVTDASAPKHFIAGVAFFGHYQNEHGDWLELRLPLIIPRRVFKQIEDEDSSIRIIERIAVDRPGFLESFEEMDNGEAVIFSQKFIQAYQQRQGSLGE